MDIFKPVLRSPIETVISQTTLADFLDLASQACSKTARRTSSTRGWDPMDMDTRPDFALARLWERMASRLATQAKAAKKYGL